MLKNAEQIFQGRKQKYLRWNLHYPVDSYPTASMDFFQSKPNCWHISLYGLNKKIPSQDCRNFCMQTFETRSQALSSLETFLQLWNLPKPKAKFEKEKVSWQLVQSPVHIWGKSGLWRLELAGNSFSKENIKNALPHLDTEQVETLFQSLCACGKLVSQWKQEFGLTLDQKETQRSIAEWIVMKISTHPNPDLFPWFCTEPLPKWLEDINWDYLLLTDSMH